MATVTLTPKSGLSFDVKKCEVMDDTPDEKEFFIKVDFHLRGNAKGRAYFTIRAATHQVALAMIESFGQQFKGMSLAQFKKAQNQLAGTEFTATHEHTENKSVPDKIKGLLFKKVNKQDHFVFYKANRGRNGFQQIGPKLTILADETIKKAKQLAPKKKDHGGGAFHLKRKRT